MRKDYVIATLIALVLSCMGSSMAGIKATHPTRISNITENSHFPAKMEEWTIGEVQIKDEEGPNKAITGISENGSRCYTHFPYNSTLH